LHPNGELSFTASGGDGPCGRATAFRVVLDGHQLAVADKPGPSGSEQRIGLGDLGPGRHTVTVQTVDAAGNASIPVTVH
jgi:hypothetical protein